MRKHAKDNKKNTFYCTQYFQNILLKFTNNILYQGNTDQSCTPSKKKVYIQVELTKNSKNHVNYSNLL